MNPHQVSQFILLERRRLKATQKQLAEKAGLTRQTISAIERGDLKNVKLSTIIDICIAFGLDLEIGFVPKDHASGGEL